MKKLNKRILTLGDLMVDEYQRGKANRISQEAPIPIIEISYKEYNLGGSGNVVANLVSLGGIVSAVGIIGQDVNGQWISQTLRRMGVNQEGIIEDNNRQTTTKTRIIASHQQVLRIDRETRHEITEYQEAKLLIYIKKHIKEWDGIIISDYNKGLLTRNLLSGVINEAKAHNVPVFVDPKGKDFSKYKGANFLTPNLQEALAAKLNKGEKDFEKIGFNMIKELELDGLIITLGADGMCIFSKLGCRDIVPTTAKNVYDIAGAGDTVVATLALCLIAGYNLKEAAIFANIAAGIVVGKPGTATISADELSEFFNKNKNLKG